MASDAQMLVDELCAHLNAPVVLEDREHRTVAYSRQAGTIDALRADSILQRTTSSEVVRWFRSFGILEARHPLHIPALAERGILPRVCAPARYRDQLLGFLWLIEAEEPIGERELAEIERAAGHAALVLFEERKGHQFVAHALANLFSSSEEVREAAARQLGEQALVQENDAVAVVVLQLSPFEGMHGCLIEEALSSAGWQVPSGSMLQVAYRDHGAVLVRLHAVEDDAMALDIAQRARELLWRRVGRGAQRAPRVIAAIGDPQLGASRAFSSYRQARTAAKVASVIGELGEVVRWRDLGAFRALAQLSSHDAMDPRVAALLNSGDDAIVATLETYLDLAGDAKATAERLHLHRGTLYYRLEKAERIAGIDMRDGLDRLAVHLGLKLARLIGPGTRQRDED